MNRAGLFQAMSINNPREKEKQVATLLTKACVEYQKICFKQPINEYTKYRKAPNIMSVPDYSSRRGVLPCFSITNFVFRNPPAYGNTHGLMALGGQSRHQSRSMVNPRPLKLPLQIPKSNVSAAMNTNIKIPN